MAFGQPLRHLETTGSTNDEAQRWALEGAPHGAVVRADEQTHGRGRQGREWCSPAGLGLYLSLILRPDIALSQVPQLTMLAGLGAARAIESETNLPANVKWPNDVILRGRKIGGVLSEARPHAENPQRVEFAIVGIGLNINFARQDLPRDAKIPGDFAVHGNRARAAPGKAS
jgi:BirA family biotin operon repressor/biotin-[acetyl-CoA-carboxylase] ligase